MLGCKKSLSRQTTCESPVSSVLSLMVSVPVGSHQPWSHVWSQSPGEGARSALLRRARGDAGRGRGERRRARAAPGCECSTDWGFPGRPWPCFHTVSGSWVFTQCPSCTSTFTRPSLACAALPQEVSYSAILVLSLRVECTALCNSVGLPLSGLFFF